MLFAALGYDGRPKTADDMQIVSNSWGNSGTVNDGWDYESRMFDFIQRFVNPYLVEGNSTGQRRLGLRYDELARRQPEHRSRRVHAVRLGRHDVRQHRLARTSSCTTTA